jgi:hypothetical protein
LVQYFPVCFYNAADENDDNGDNIPYVPPQNVVIYYPTCFGTGRELTSKERLEFLKKQREIEIEEAENKKKKKRMIYNK